MIKRTVCLNTVFLKAMLYSSEPFYHFFKLCNTSESARYQCLNIYGTWQLLKTGVQCEKACFFETEELLSIRSKEGLQQSRHLLDLIKPLKEFQFSPSPLLNAWQLHSANSKKQLLEIRAVQAVTELIL